jgi:GT2 family glycosyltransferase
MIPERPGPVTVSIVSHGHRELVLRLLAQLSRNAGPVGTVVLTHNLPDAAVPAPAGGWPFRFVETFNPAPRGFAANHNQAFRHCDSGFFCVLNPDIELDDDSIWQRLLESASQPGVGCAYPVLLNADGTRQENEREAVSPLALLRRHFLKRPQRAVDWASGAFWLVPAAAWRGVGGLDEGYFMYCEDTDFCLRLQLAGWRLARADAAATHDAGWGSRSDSRHLAWHLKSLLRLWSRPVLWRYLLARPRLLRGDAR